MAASTDSASLVIRVDATETNKGAEALDKLTVSADGASKSVDNLAKSEEDAKARIKAMVQASMEKVQAQNASIASGQREVQMTDAQRAAVEKLNAASNTQADMNARGAAILAAEERTRKAATVTIAEQTGALSKLLGQIDPTIAGYERLDAMQAKLAAFRKSGAISGDDYALFSGKIAQMRAEVDKASGSVHKFSVNNAGARRELGYITKDLATGQWGRMSQSLSTLAVRSNALSLVMSPLGLAIAAVGATIGAFAIAALQGYNESEKLRTTVIATGGAAGVTASQFNAMAVGVGEATGKWGEAREAIEGFAASGKVAGAGIGGIGIQAVNMATVTGESVDKAVAKIIEMGERPSETIAKLNEQYHFLTSAQYAQIAALEAEGKVREAGRLANALDAKAMADRAKDVEDNAGIMERAGHAVASAWGKAWDAMKGVGRKQDLGEQVRAVQGQIDRLTGAVGAGQVDNRVNKPDSPEIRALRAQLEALRHQQAQAAFDDNAKQLSAQGNTDAIAAQKRLSAFMSPADTRDNAIKKANADRLAALYGVVDPAQRARIEERAQKQIDDANKAYASATKTSTASKHSASDPFASLNGLVQGAQVFDAGVGGNKQQSEQVTKILAVVDAGARLIAKGEDVATVQAKVAAGVAALNEGYAKQADQLKAQNVVAIAEYQAALDKQNDALQRTINSQIDKVGMGDKEYARQQQINDLYVKGAQAMTDLQLRRASVAAKGGDTSVLDANIAALQANTDKQVQIVTDGYKRMDAAQGDWINGMTSSLANYLDQASDVAGQSAQVFTNAFEGMSNSLANFATTGKGSFKGLVASILSDLAKMELRIAMSKILQQVLGAYLGGVTTQTYSGGPSYIGGNGTGGYGMQIQNAKGGVYSSPSLSQYSGQVVNRPTMFAFAKGAGVMGEAGPEAIMPLSRGSDGKLGVKASGGGGDIIVNTNVTVDSNGNASSDTASSNDSARQLGAMVSNKVKEVMMSESRPGGMLWKMQH